MLSAIAKTIAAANGIARETLVDFQAFAATQGVDIPEELLTTFLEGLPKTKGGKAPKATRSPSRNPFSSFLVYRKENKDDILENLYDANGEKPSSDTDTDGEGQDTGFLGQFQEPDEDMTDAEKKTAEKNLERVSKIRAWAAARKPDQDANANVIAQMASLMWFMEDDDTHQEYKAKAAQMNADHQAANLGLASPPSKAATKTRSPRKAAAPESIENFMNINWIKFETDEEHAGGCGAWLNKSNKYCQRTMKAGTESAFCKAHTEKEVLAREKFPEDPVADDTDTEIDED